MMANKITCEDAVRALKIHGLSTTAKCLAQFLPGADSRAVATALRKATNDGRVNIRYTKKGIAFYRFVRLTAKLPDNAESNGAQHPTRTPC
jgi:hypothetical protein